MAYTFGPSGGQAAAARDATRNYNSNAYKPTMAAPSPPTQPNAGAVRQPAGMAATLGAPRPDRGLGAIPGMMPRGPGFSGSPVGPAAPPPGPPGIPGSPGMVKSSPYSVPGPMPPPAAMGLGLESFGLPPIPRGAYGKAIPRGRARARPTAKSRRY